MEEIIIGENIEENQIPFDEDSIQPTLAKELPTTDIVQLLKSHSWSDRFHGYELIIGELLGSKNGLQKVHEKELSIAKLLEEKHLLVRRKAYKAVSIYINQEDNLDTIENQYTMIAEQVLKVGITNKFTYKYAQRIICQLFEKLSSLEKLNILIYNSLGTKTKAVNTVIGLFTLLNFLTYKYGPVKVDTTLFVNIAGDYTSHAKDNVRK